MQRILGRLGVLMATVVALGLPAFAVAGAAETPGYGGLMAFPHIDGPADPEEFSWHVTLSEGQKLHQLDDRHAAVIYSDGELSFVITASEAHDADGTSVPTTLAVTGEDVVTLIVHHRAGNPADGSAYDYPVAEGAPYEVGYSSVQVVMPPPEPMPTEPMRTESALLSPLRVLVRNNLGSDDLSYRPHRFYLSADGTFGILGVRWDRYGNETAVATATAYANDCVPFCAAGTFHRPKAKVWLTKIVRCGGQYLYAHFRYVLRGHVPDNIPRRGQFSVLPRDDEGEFDC